MGRHLRRSPHATPSCSSLYNRVPCVAVLRVDCKFGGYAAASNSKPVLQQLVHKDCCVAELTR
eukprot:1409812-Pyramimonas_sp.AAC.1